MIWVIWDIIRLFQGNISGHREHADRFSNGDQNKVLLSISHTYDVKIEVAIIDELPIEFQIRDTNWRVFLEPCSQTSFSYNLRPVKRGLYTFGRLLLYARMPYGLFQRRFICEKESEVAVYPSFHRLKEYQFLAFSRNSVLHGLKRKRRIGISSEFEQIKTYVPGDDVRHMNWKASARSGSLMLNQFRDERSQQLVCMVDKGRRMEMPFEGMTLLDYAINASLAISDIALRSDDRVGLLTFGDKLSSYVAPEKGLRHLNRLQEALYYQRTNFLDTNVKLGVSWLTRKLYERSLLLYFTNYASVVSMERHLDYLRTLSKRHLLVVILFKNRPLEELAACSPGNQREAYQQIIAEQLVQEKLLLSRKFHRNGILTILCYPEELSVSVINRYLQIKKEMIV